MKKKIFSFALPNSLISDDANSYLWYTEGVSMVSNKLNLREGASVRFDTYHNFFPLHKYQQITNYSEFEVHIKGSGECVVDIVELQKDDFYIKQRVIKVQQLSLPTNEGIIISSNSDLIYIKVSALSPVVIDNIYISAKIESPNDVTLSYCICSFNRENYVKSFVGNIAESLKEDPRIRFCLVLNGSDYKISYPDNVDVIYNRNLGGAGGFTRGIVHSLLNKGKFSHVILADDDITVSLESIFRTLALLEGIKREFSDCFISGAMLSLDQPWLQYERKAVLTNRGFEHYGGGLDTRDNIKVIHDIINSITPGLAGWWYCVIPIRVFEDFGLPLPIFVRGDDVEFSTRCGRRVISINGICVWHEPFVKKYNEIMEDYYLVRNMSLISLIYSDVYRQIRRQFVIKKFLKNILIFDYVAAQFNIDAIKDVLEQKYHQDAESLHQELIQKLNQRLKSVPQWEGDDRVCYPSIQHSKLSTLLRIFLQYVFGIRFCEGFSGGGFERRISTFVGRTHVITYQGNYKFRCYKFSWLKALQLCLEFSGLYVKFLLAEKKLIRDAVDFLDKSKDVQFWQKLFK